MKIPEYNKELLQHYFTNGFFEIRMVPTGTIGEAYVNIKENEYSDFKGIFHLKNENIISFLDDCIDLANTKEELIRIIDMQYDIIKKNYSFFVEEQE